MSYEVEQVVVETRPGCWNAGEYIVRKDGVEVTRFKRNYSSPCYKIAEQDGFNWLFCSENYHGGMTAINLDTGERANYNPPETKKNQQFWCLASMTDHDPEKKTLTVSGCYWAAPWDITTYDVSNPLALPWPTLSVVEEPYEEESGDEP